MGGGPPPDFWLVKNWEGRILRGVTVTGPAELKMIGFGDGDNRMKRFRVRGFSLALVLLAAACAGPSYQLSLKPFSLMAIDYPLPSGLRVIFQHDKTQASVAVFSVIGAGMTSDPGGKEGLAHLVEHLAFRARPAGGQTVMDQVKEMGGVFNAYTTPDYTSYWTIAPRDAVVQLLRIEAMRMIKALPGITEEEFATEKEVVRNEKFQRSEASYGGRQIINNRIFEELNRMLYPAGHRYQRAGIGSHESLDRITLADARAFVREHYRPRKTTIMIIGNFDQKEVRRLLSRSFPPQVVTRSGKPEKNFKLGNPIARTSPKLEPPYPKVTALRRIKGPVTNDTLFLAWSLPPGFNEDYWELNSTTVLTNIAMWRTFAPKDPLSRDIVELAMCFMLPGELASTAFCAVELVPGQKPEEIVEKTLDGLYRQWSSGGVPLDMSQKVQAGIYGRVRAYQMNDLLRSAVPLHRGALITSLIHYTSHVDVFSRAMNAVSKVSAFKARQIAYKYLTRERAVRLLVQPEERKPSTVAFDPAASWSGAVFERTAAQNKRFVKLPRAEIARAAVAMGRRTLKTFTLSNGLQVVLKQHGWAPFVRVALLTRGGLNTTEPEGIPQFARLKHDAKEPLVFAGTWFFELAEDRAAWGVTAPSGNLSAALHLLHERVRTTRSDWDEWAFKRMLRRTARQQQSMAKDPEVRAERALWERLLPGHPLARRVCDTKRLAGVDRGKFKGWAEQVLAPKNATLFVVGDLEFGQARKLAAKVWGQWRDKDPGQPLELLPPPNAPGKGILLIDRPESSQTKLMLGCHLPPATADNDVDRAVLGTLLREDLWQAIRQKNGASYGANAWSTHYPGGTSLLQISGYIQNDKAVPALSTILERLAEVGRGRINRALLLKAMWTVARRTHIQNLNLEEMLDTLARTAHSGWPLGKLADFSRRLSQVSPRHLTKQLEPCAGKEVIAVVGPRALLEEKLKTLGRAVEIIADSK